MCIRDRHGTIPHSPATPSLVPYEADLWLMYPIVTVDTWDWGGVPQLPDDHQPDKSVKCTKFGGVQSLFCLPKAVYPLQPQEPPVGRPEGLGAWRTWRKPEQPTLWKELEPREYLDRTVWPSVFKGLSVIERTRPKNPTKALAMFLLQNQSQSDNQKS
eukprot:TRINITY_DN8201_c0_g1_i1.p1 TRINITY_DN8201_c0_g1~~TRINITY_DN8201_c0_g1_i1.p1  ORF type:complete len:158 (+),score=48.97 TRINITY_DN8201_c0_g1_i1:163-636(+)